MRPANRHGDCGVVSGDWLQRSPRLAEAAGGGVSGRGLCSSARRFREEQRLPGGDAGEGRADSAALCPGLRVPQHPEPGAETQAGEIGVPLRGGHGLPVSRPFLPGRKQILGAHAER
ncbi:uncharacterized protein LOC143827479 isoform X3 [Paroedura picta]|uniref:uncharacterized protein LOC143827479 isoform X3 n=1 Tax=Paroedura picta TaxID=143630 RepID=UPI0040569C55